MVEALSRARNPLSYEGNIELIALKVPIIRRRCIAIIRKRRGAWLIPQTAFIALMDANTSVALLAQEIDRCFGGHYLALRQLDMERQFDLHVAILGLRWMMFPPFVKIILLVGSSFNTILVVVTIVLITPVHLLVDMDGREEILSEHRPEVVT